MSATLHVPLSRLGLRGMARVPSRLSSMRSTTSRTKSRFRGRANSFGIVPTSNGVMTYDREVVKLPVAQTAVANKRTIAPQLANARRPWLRRGRHVAHAVEPEAGPPLARAGSAPAGEPENR